MDTSHYSITQMPSFSKAAAQYMPDGGLKRLQEQLLDNPYRGSKLLNEYDEFRALSITSEGGRQGELACLYLVDEYGKAIYLFAIIPKGHNLSDYIKDPDTMAMVIAIVRMIIRIVTGEYSSDT